MSELLDDLIGDYRRGVTEYEAYLKQLIEHAKKVAKGESEETAYPAWADNGAKRALIDFELPDGATTAQAVDKAVMETKRADWVGNRIKEKQVRNALRAVLPEDFDQLDELMELVKARREYR